MSASINSKLPIDKRTKDCTATVIVSKYQFNVLTFQMNWLIQWHLRDVVGNPIRKAIF